MAFQRSISTRANQLYKHRFIIQPHMFPNLHDHDHNKPRTPTSTFVRNIGTLNNLFRTPRCPDVAPIPGFGMLFIRSMSGDVESVIKQAAGGAVNEVAVAGADSFIPVAGLQYLIDYVHAFTGFNWWASIAATTFLIRYLTLPLIINQLKATSKFTLLRPKLEEVKNEVQAKGMSSAAVAEGQAKMNALFKEYNVTPFTPLKGLLIQGPVFICFFLAVKGMAEKVPSFQQGGAYWFLDLTTPDSLYILPVLTGLTVWITVEFNMQEGMVGNSAAKTIKNVSRGFAALTVPLTASFPKAIFCYWITSNVFSIVYGLVIKRPQVKKLLGIPVTPAPTDQQKGSFFSDAIKSISAARAEDNRKAQMQIQQQPPSESPAEALKLQYKKPSSSAVLSQSPTSLEKKVKGRKKDKNR